MSSTLQDTRAQRNAAHARSSGSAGHVVNVHWEPFIEFLESAFHYVMGYGKRRTVYD